MDNVITLNPETNSLHTHKEHDQKNSAYQVIKYYDIRVQAFTCDFARVIKCKITQELCKESQTTLGCVDTTSIV